MDVTFNIFRPQFSSVKWEWWKALFETERTTQSKDTERYETPPSSGYLIEIYQVQVGLESLLISRTPEGDSDLQMTHCMRVNICYLILRH